MRRSRLERRTRTLFLCVPKTVAGEGNRKWLGRLGDEDGVILIGGTTLADFGVRVAQSALRDDMLPSYWGTM